MTQRPDAHCAESMGESLAGLNAGGASPGFTARVLEELGARRVRRRRRQITSSALGILVAVVAGVLVTGRATGPTATDVALEAQQLRQEYLQLQNDLEALRADSRETAPVIYLGGDDELDLVLDLAPIVTHPAAGALRASTTNHDPYEL